MRVLRNLCLAMAFSLSFSPLVPAMMVLPVDLNELVVAAERIVVGTVTAVEEGKDTHGMPCTFITMRSARTIKGTPGATFTFKQLGGTMWHADGSLLRIPGMPMYQAGEEVMLFLYPTSAAGFTSPVGLGQGKFTIVRQGGKAQVMNGFGNVNLRHAPFRKDTSQAPTALAQNMPIELDQFLSVVQGLVEQAPTLR